MLRLSEKIELENVNHPGHVTRVPLDRYEAMKRAFLKILPKTSPGLTVAEIQQRVIAHLPEELFPDGAKADWWTKAVQLDLGGERYYYARENQAAPLAKACQPGAITINRAESYASRNGSL